MNGRQVTALLAILAIVLSGALGFYFATITVAAAQNTAAPSHASVTITAIADLRMGPDNDTHDTFVPSNFTVYTGQTVDLTLVNYDDMPHSFTSPSLGVDFAIPPALGDGVPSVTHYQFTVSQSGSFRYYCVTPCDEWAMGIDPTDGKIGMLGFMGGYVNVLSA